MTTTHVAGRTTRRAAAAAAAVLAFGGVAACGSDSAGQEAGAVSAGDLRDMEDRIGALEDQVSAMEEGMGGGALAGDAGDAMVFEDPQSQLGQEVTISAEVSELYTTTDVGSAMRIAGESGEPIAVVSASPIAEIDANDVVKVTGTVVQVQRASFEADFGVAADELFQDADGFFVDAEGETAIAADQIQVTQEASSN